MHNVAACRSTYRQSACIGVHNSVHNRKPLGSEEICQVELTDRFCQTAKPGATADRLFRHSGEGAFLASAAGAKTFYLNYTPDSKRARMKLGRYPEMKLGKAREKAREARGDIGEGTDPLVEKRAQVASQTVADLIENYVSRHATTKRTGPAIARRLRFNIAPRIGS